jgi:hypothetical protein
MKRFGTIYGLYDTSGVLRYIGQTTGPLTHRLSSHLTPASQKSGTHHAHWVKAMMERGERIFIRPLCEADSRDELDGLEQAWIAAARASGVRLTNACNGGLGKSGYLTGPMSAERRAKISIAQKGVPRPYARGPRDPAIIEKGAAKRRGQKRPHKALDKHPGWDDSIDTERDILAPLRAGKTEGQVVAALGRGRSFMRNRLRLAGVSIRQIRAAQTPTL